MIGWLIGAVVALVASLGGVLARGGMKRLRRERDAAQGYRETRERMDDAENGNDPAAHREWLRNRDADKR